MAEQTSSTKPGRVSAADRVPPPTVSGYHVRGPTMSSEPREGRSSREGEAKVELHSRVCSCGGGSWIILGEASHAPCSRDVRGSQAGVVILLSEWRSLGKPSNMESYAECANRVARGERREFKRYEAAMRVKLSRIPSAPKDNGSSRLIKIQLVSGCMLRHVSCQVSSMCLIS